MDLRDRLTGTLLGTALGDALGLPAEGMSARRIARRFGRVHRFHLLGRTGFVSDDTEQSALVAQSLARHPGDRDLCVRAFRRSLLGWFWRLPWGVGLATVRASFRIMLGRRPSGVRSAGNGAAMRAAVLGAYFHDRPDERRA
ncbi:MAG TPA: ADP-ribosylglycohydrolase family protein, partial [Planctomycetota bacterium]|nr:ADP-ribosylglycohydrolase family protein [Planctomycetota bacterium]